MVSENELINLINLYKIGYQDENETIEEIVQLQNAISQLSEDKKNQIVNYQDESGNTALIIAVSSGNINITKKLLDLPHINPNIANRHKQCALIESLNILNDDTIFYAIASHPKTDIHMRYNLNQGLAFKLAENNKLNILKDLIENKNLDYDYSDKLNHNILHMAIYSKNTELIDYFIQKGIDINQYSKENITPMDIAILLEEISIMNFLLPLIDIKKHTHSFKQSVFNFHNSEVEEFMYNTALCNIESLESFLNDTYWQDDSNFTLYCKKIKPKLTELYIQKEREDLEKKIALPINSSSSKLKI